MMPLARQEPPLRCTQLREELGELIDRGAVPAWLCNAALNTYAELELVERVDTMNAEAQRIVVAAETIIEACRWSPANGS